MLGMRCEWEHLAAHTHEFDTVLCVPVDKFEKVFDILEAERAKMLWAKFSES